MFKPARHIFITALITVLAFISTTYVSCKKDETAPSPDKCANIVCENGGSCFKGMCSCPGGYEGDRCQVKTMARYTGNWEVKETVSISADASKVGTVRMYQMNIREKEGSEIVFLIDNFMGQQNYDNVQAEQGRDEKSAPAAYTTFSFVKDQLLGGTTSYIVSGTGSVNSIGTVLTGTYTIAYVSGNDIKKDTITFEASHL